MMTYLNQRKGQSTLEYAVLIIVIIGALISIQVYIKRGVQGRLKSASDDIGDQYSPGNTNIIVAEHVKSHEKQTFSAGVQSTTLNEDEITNSVTKSVILNKDQEYWGGGDSH